MGLVGKLLGLAGQIFGLFFKLLHLRLINCSLSNIVFYLCRCLAHFLSTVYISTTSGNQPGSFSNSLSLQRALDLALLLSATEPERGLEINIQTGKGRHTPLISAIRSLGAAVHTSVVCSSLDRPA
jgi:hypothetical protein